MPLFNPCLVFPPAIMSISGGTTFATGPGVSLANANGVTFGIIGNTITASVNAVTVSGVGVAIAAGTQTGSTGTIVFSNSNGVSFGLSGSTRLTASVETTPISVFSQWGGFETNYSMSNGQVSYQKVSMPMPLSGSSGVVLLDLSGHSNSSGGLTISVGAYALSGGTAASLTTASGGFTWASGSNTSASTVYGGVSGTRYRSFNWGVSMTPGDYLFAVAVSISNDGSARIFGRQGVNIVGTGAGVETLFFVDGVSISTTAGFPTSIAATDSNYARTGLSAVQQPGFILIGTF